MTHQIMEYLTYKCHYGIIGRERRIYAHMELSNHITFLILFHKEICLFFHGLVFLASISYIHIKTSILCKTDIAKCNIVSCIMEKHSSPRSIEDGMRLYNISQIGIKYMGMFDNSKSKIHISPRENNS